MNNIKIKKYIHKKDFKIKITPIDEKTTEFKSEIFFNQNRYEYKVKNEEEGFFDKYEGHFIPLKELFPPFKKNNHLSVSAPPSRIKNKIKYYEERYDKLDDYYSEEFKNKTMKSAENLVFMSVDIVNSTGRSKKLNIEDNTITNLLFLKEIEEIINRHEGKVVKFVGDGLIAYFPSHNLSDKVDNSIDCAITIKTFVEKYINKFLTEKDITRLKFRIGINYGEGCIVNINEQDDIYGHALNITYKIQECAEVNQIVIGSKSNQKVNSHWRGKLEKIEYDYKKEKTPELENIILYRLKSD